MHSIYICSQHIYFWLKAQRKTVRVHRAKCYQAISKLLIKCYKNVPVFDSLFF